MGFLKKLMGGSEPTRQTFVVFTDDGRWWGVNGCDHYTANMAPFIHKSVPDFRYQHELDEVMVALVPDPTIEYVENAVRVDLAGKRIGHLSAQTTQEANWMIRKSWDSGGALALLAQARFSWELKAGPFYAEVRLPRNWAKAELVPASQVTWVRK